MWGVLNCKMLQLQLQFWSIVLSFTSSMLQLQFKTNSLKQTIAVSQTYFVLCCSCWCSSKRHNLCLADIVLCCCCSCSFEEALCLCHSLMTLLQLQFYTSIVCLFCCCSCSCSFEEALCLCHSLITLLQLQFYNSSVCLFYCCSCSCSRNF